jgi:hypothetical protein
MLEMVSELGAAPLTDGTRPAIKPPEKTAADPTTKISALKEWGKEEGDILIDF